MKTKQKISVSYIWVSDNQFALPAQDVQERKANFGTVWGWAESTCLHIQPGMEVKLSIPNIN